jgi:hypothetical protein
MVESETCKLARLKTDANPLLSEALSFMSWFVMGESNCWAERNSVEDCKLFLFFLVAMCAWQKNEMCLQCGQV